MKSPEDEVLEDVLDEDVQRALDILPPDYRMAVILADLEGFSYKEIAEILELPVGDRHEPSLPWEKAHGDSDARVCPRAWVSAIG